MKHSIEAQEAEWHERRLAIMEKLAKKIDIKLVYRDEKLRKFVESDPEAFARIEVSIEDLEHLFMVLGE